MKKLFSLFLALILCFSLCACGGGSETSNSSKPSVELWKVQKEVDEFGDEIPNGANIVMAPISGDFSNTATSSSELTGSVIMQIQDNYPMFAFILMEYGDHQATYTSSDTLAIKTKIDDTIFEYEEILSSPPNGPLAVCDTWETLYTSLYTGTDVRCIIEIGSSQYNFTLQSADFAEACKESGYITKAMYYNDTDNDILFEEANDLIEKGVYDEAIDILKYLKDNETLYSTAKLLLEKEEYDTAIEIIQYLDGYADSKDLLLDTVCKAQLAGDHTDVWKDIFFANTNEPLSGDELKKVIVGDWYSMAGTTYSTYTKSGEYYYTMGGTRSTASDGKWTVSGDKLTVKGKFTESTKTIYPFYKNAYVFCTQQDSGDVYEIYYLNGSLE